MNAKSTAGTQQDNVSFEQRERQIIEKLKSGEFTSYSKEVREFESEKIAEMKRNAPLFLIYRDNDLFRKHLPIIQKGLIGMGRQLEAQVFPQGTNETDIQNWYEENIDALSHKAVISDQTASIPYETSGVAEFGKKAKYEFGVRTVGSLDKMVMRSLYRVIHEGSEIGLDSNNRGEGLGREASRELLVCSIKNILKNPENSPEKVLIFSSNMGDHLDDFDFETGEIPGEKEGYRTLAEKEALEKYPATGEMTETQRKQRLASVLTEKCDIATKLVESWLVEAGIDQSKIEIINEEIRGELNRIPGTYFDDPQREMLATYNRPNTWVITDRHTGITNDESETNAPLRLTTVLRMPQSNFFEDVIRQDLVSFTGESLEKAWDGVLKSEFGS